MPGRDASSSPRQIPRRSFGRYADQVSIIGLGGYHLGNTTNVAQAVRIVHEAIDAGITFLDNAWEYHEGESEKRMGKAIADRRDAIALRYAMSLPVCTTVSGIDSLKVLRQNLKIARDFAPMNAREKRVYEHRLRENANDGRYELYKTSAEHEGEEGRRQHGFPSQGEVAL